ncbi:MAG: Zn-dependent protease component of TldD/TldE system [Candidatus Methanohalarchaeum thermophilum]|uniref:Zn-dependent protease component of TldD/TldE system n=1 Tax=Methanohalarchaeum thermophilum TaxID=1903181 RepID=A0A1Q6DT73_METT1|nr:MAG: Zn-dependent protease component of TldD/TldE system [Candidatus Methanohalarchaeum thermophilum]
MTDFYEIIEVNSDGNTITLEDGEVDEVTSTSVDGFYARALVNQRWGFASTTSMNKEETLKRAKKSARQNNSNEKQQLAETKKLNKEINLKPNKNPKEIPISEKIDLLKDCYNKANQKKIKSTKFQYSDQQLVFNYENSEGSLGRYKLNRTGLSGKAIAKEGNEIQTASTRVYGTKGFEIFKENDIYDKSKQMGEKAIDLLDAKRPPSGKMPAIMGPELAGVFVHEAVGHATEGDIVSKDNSILKGKVGEKIGNEKVNIKDNPSLKGKYGSIPFDWEGIRAQETKLVESGKLLGYLNSRETAKTNEGRVTPNSRSESFSSTPQVRMTNTYLEEGNWSLEEMIEEIQEGILLTGSRGGQVSTGEGTFQFNAEDGYLIKDGEKKDQVKDVSLSGKTLEVLKNIKGLGKEKEFSPGRCGKGGQLVPVSDGAPYTYVEDLLVGGGSDF